MNAEVRRPAYSPQHGDNSVDIPGHPQDFAVFLTESRIVAQPLLSAWLQLYPSLQVSTLSTLY